MHNCILLEANPSVSNLKMNYFLEIKLANKLLGNLKSGQICKSINVIHEGGNNLVFKIESSSSQFLMKKYFRDVENSNDRLNNETQFSQFLTKNNIECAPKMVAFCEIENAALFEFITGKKITNEELTDQHVNHAVNFLRLLNNRRNIGSEKLPLASDAEFSLSGHLILLEKRLASFDNSSDEISPTITKLRDFFDFLKSEIISGYSKLKIDPNHALSFSDRCISPSDFGFHNALISADSSVKFFDFEYAGWDDPAKTAADIIFQPEISVPDKFYEVFLEQVTANSQDVELAKSRARILKPLFGLKWCCIMLNCFRDGWVQQQEFANPDIDRVNFKNNQLKKAEYAFSKLINS